MQPPNKNPAVDHARWITDAMQATEEAAAYVKAHPEIYPDLDARKMEIVPQDRAVAFHEKNSGQDASVLDAVMDAMRWQTPPEQMREIEAMVKRRELERQIARLNNDLQEARTQMAMWRDMALKNADDDRDPEDDDRDPEDDEDYD